MAQMTQGQNCGVGFDLAAEGLFWVESIEACRWLKKKAFHKNRPDSPPKTKGCKYRQPKGVP